MVGAWGKDVETMMRVLADEYHEFELELRRTASHSPAAAPPAGALSRTAVDMGFDEDVVHVAERLDEACSEAIQDAAAREQFDGAVLVTGSITVVGRALLACDPSRAPLVTAPGRYRMARMTKAQREWRPGQPEEAPLDPHDVASCARRIEAFIVFFAALTAYSGCRPGLEHTPEAAG
ncbi:hypothetical protein QJS66_01685 [Kocuria rhizophila]|nr:hypothetical protein QJS66_01685 [Kocuria rhizophila]